MSQINIRVTKALEDDLLVVMSTMKLFGKSKAIRFAVHEMAEVFRTNAQRKTAGANAGSGASL